jgi:DNA repair protein RecO (recombination protein O)
LKSFVTNALLVRQVAYGESDVIATLFTEAEGKLGVMVRGGRKSCKRVGGALEPFHTLEARIDDRGGELGALREARIVRVRAGIVATLEAIDAAGTALRWLRHLCPPRTREPEAWLTVNELLDALDAAGGVAPDGESERSSARSAPKVALAECGLRLLADVGYGLDLERCIQCGKECPPARSARIDPARGGLVCSTCVALSAPLSGGRGVVVSAELRAKAIAAVTRSDPTPMTPVDAEAILALVDAAMAAHAGFDR